MELIQDVLNGVISADPDTLFKIGTTLAAGGTLLASGVRILFCFFSFFGDFVKTFYDFFAFVF